ncbi:hypothetical protein ATCC90586_010931 [Pythium insidiosum]|nr:hypothetical protein ATCC90586_010931 [Pythium insidiosum]
MAVFVALLVTGLQTREEIKLTQILQAAPNDKNTVCTNLGVYTGNSPRFALDAKAVLKALSQPSQQPVNCKTAEDLRLPDGTKSDFGQMGVTFHKAYFATFDDCVAKLPGMMETIASRMTFEYQRFVVRAEFPPYASQKDFGDSAAYVKWSAYDFLFNAPPNCTSDVTNKICSLPKGNLVTPWFRLFDATGQEISSCLVDGSNLLPHTDEIGRVIPNSAIDLFHRYAWPRLVLELFKDRYAERRW